jgi:hypothetical protein
VKVTPPASAATWVTLGGPGVPGAADGGWGVEFVLKVALTEVAELTVTTQAVVPLQPPPHPTNVDPDVAAALSVTGVPGITDCVQAAPQVMPAGTLVTVPVPVPFFVTDSVTVAPPVAEPLTPHERVSPLAMKLTLLAKLPALVGWNRTVTVWVAPGASEKEPPATIRNGAAMLAAPEMAPLLVFCTVNVRSTVAPLAMLPKLVVTDGVTLKSGWATPLAEVDRSSVWSWAMTP